MKNLISSFLLLLVPLVATAESGLHCAKSVFSQPNVRFMQKVNSSHANAVLGVKGLPAGLQ